MNFSVDRLRRETPGCKHKIHFNNAGASLMPDPVVEAYTQYIRQEAAEGGYETAEAQRKKINQTYESIARLINAQSDEIALAEHATGAWNQAFYSIPFEAGDRILTSRAEYASNFISYLNLRRQKDITIDVIPSDQSGQISLEALQDMIDTDVRLISVTHIPTNGGLVNPVEAIGQIASNHGILYLVDACQSIGQYPVNVQKMGCDMLSATGRKFLRGPRGTGFLYVRHKVLKELAPPFPDLHSATWTGKHSFKLRDDARRFEQWEKNYAAVVGLQKAVDYASNIGLDAIWKRVTGLAEKLRNELQTIPTVEVHDLGEQKCGIVTFTEEHLDAETIKKQLGKRNINVSVSGKSSTLLDMQDRQLDQLVRTSVHYYNTEKEIQTFTRQLEEIIQGAGNS